MPPHKVQNGWSFGRVNWTQASNSSHWNFLRFFLGTAQQCWTPGFLKNIFLPSQQTSSNKTLQSRWFKMPFSSPSWRSLNLSKRSLNHPKKVTAWITRNVFFSKKAPRNIPQFSGERKNISPPIRAGTMGSRRGFFPNFLLGWRFEL